MANSYVRRTEELDVSVLFRQSTDIFVKFTTKLFYNFIQEMQQVVIPYQGLLKVVSGGQEQGWDGQQRNVWPEGDRGISIFQSKGRVPNC